MSKIAAVVVSKSAMETYVVAEALERAARSRESALSVELNSSLGRQNALSEKILQEADVLLFVGAEEECRQRPEFSRFQRVELEEVMSNASEVLQKVMEQRLRPLSSTSLKIVAVTSCPTGIAHTFMAAEGLTQGAKELGWQIHVETQGSVGAQNKLSSKEIEEAELVIIAADTQVDKGRFFGKRIYELKTKEAIRDGRGVIQKALQEAQVYQDAHKDTQKDTSRSPSLESKTGPYKHLMTGVSFMLPFVVAGGLLIALSFALGGVFATDEAQKNTLAGMLFQIGAKGAFALMVPALAGYIAFSIADRPGLAPGMIGGLLAVNLGAGFLGGILAGFVAGYAVQFLNQKIRLPSSLEGLKPVLILPLLSSAIVGLLMLSVVGAFVASVMNALESGLMGLQSGHAAILGAVLGGMMAVDMGGPVNKAAYAFSVGLIGSQIYSPIAAVIIGGMTPPLGIALATVLFKKFFSAEEREAGKATAVLGLSFITEGAIPFAARDPLRVISACVLGSAVAGAVAMAGHLELKAPHGGVFIMLIPNAVSRPLVFVLALALGALVTSLTLGFLKYHQLKYQQGKKTPNGAN